VRVWVWALTSTEGRLQGKSRLVVHILKGAHTSAPKAIQKALCTPKLSHKHIPHHCRHTYTNKKLVCMEFFGANVNARAPSQATSVAPFDARHHASTPKTHVNTHKQRTPCHPATCKHSGNACARSRATHTLTSFDTQHHASNDTEHVHEQRAPWHP